MRQPKAWIQDTLIPPEPDGHFVMIPLTRGKFALIDEADAETVLNMGRWRAIKAPRGRTYYAEHEEPGPRLVRLQWLITGCKGVDHVNRNGLDNRRINLRPATPSQQGANRRRFSNNKSGYKGVSWDQKNKNWRATIGVRGHRRQIGRFADPVDAARAYNAAAWEAWGEYAHLNPLPPDVTEPPAA